MAEFTFKVKGGREDFRRTSVILLNSGASHPKVADDGTVTVRADRGNPFAGIAAQLRNESVKAFFQCDTVKVAGIRNRQARPRSCAACSGFRVSSRRLQTARQDL